MSQHPSLLGAQKGKGHRSVFKRYEKLKHLIEKDKWNKEKDSVYKLPKIKSIKFKIKKEKPVAEAGTAADSPAQAAGTAGQAPAQTGASKPAAEKQAPQKEKKAKA